MSATARKCGRKLSLEKGFDIRCYDACCFESLKRIAGVVRGDREQRAIRIGDHVEASGFAVLLAGSLTPDIAAYCNDGTSNQHYKRRPSQLIHRQCTSWRVHEFVSSAGAVSGKRL